MYNIDDIFNALQSGTDPEKIANDFTTALNAAIAKKEAEDQEAERKKAAKIREKEIALNDILDDIFDFLEEYYPDIYSADLRTSITPNEVIKILDTAYVDTIKQFKQLSDNIKLLENRLTKEIKSPLKNDPITNFLHLNKLL